MAHIDRAELQPAYVLHTRAYRETSLVAELVTYEFGRIGLMARGAKRPKSAMRGHLQLFVPVLVSWRGRGELPTMTGIEPAGRFSALPPSSLVPGLYLNELMVRLLQRGDPHPGLFENYSLALAGLAHGRVQPVLRTFEARLLEAIGYGLRLRSEVGSDRPIDPGERYRYIPEEGPIPVTGSSSRSGIEIAGATLIALSEGVLESREQLGEAKRLMRSLLSPHLGDRPLASRELLRR